MPKAQKKPVPVARNAEEKSRAVAAAMKSQGTKDAAMKKIRGPPGRMPL